MNNAKAQYLKVSCPVCRAPIGQKCDISVKEFNGLIMSTLRHQMIREAAAPVAPVQPWFARETISSRYEGVKGSQPCGMCRHGMHKQCSGVGKRNHGMPGPVCTCQCEWSLQNKAERRLKDGREQNSSRT